MKPDCYAFTQRRWFIAISFIAVVCVLLVPVMSVEHMQTIDLVNHLARQFVRAEIPSGGVLSKMYTFQWMIIPDLAVDAFIAPLQHYFSIYDCGRLLVGAIIILWTFAPLALHRALWGRWSVWPLLASMVVYNGNLTWGFDAYLLTSACAVIAFAGWVATENKPAIARVAGFTLLSFVLYSGHLIAFGVFGVLVGGYELSKLYFAGDLRPSALFRRGIFLSPLFGPELLHFVYLNVTSPPAHGTDTIAFSVMDRLMTLLSPFLDGMTTVGETPHTQVALLNFLFLACVVGFLALRNSLAIHRNMIPSLVVLFVAAAIMPPKLIGVSYTHLRLPFVAVSLFLSSLEAREKKGHVYAAIAACFAVLTVVRIAFIADNWKIYDAQSKEFIARTAFIHAGEKVLVTNNRYPAAYVEHYHTASLLVIENQAFIPNLFSGTHVFHAIGDYLRLSPATATHPLDAKLLQLALDGKNPRLNEPAFSYWKTWWKDYDFVIAYQPPGHGDFYQKQLQPVSEGSFFTVYKVKK